MYNENIIFPSLLSVIYKFCHYRNVLLKSYFGNLSGFRFFNDIKKIKRRKINKKNYIKVVL